MPCTLTLFFLLFSLLLGILGQETADKNRCSGSRGYHPVSLVPWRSALCNSDLLPETKRRQRVKKSFQVFLRSCLSSIWSLVTITTCNTSPENIIKLKSFLSWNLALFIFVAPPAVTFKTWRNWCVCDAFCHDATFGHTSENALLFHVNKKELKRTLKFRGHLDEVKADTTWLFS